PIATDASGCRGYLVCRAGFAGRDTPLAQAIERYNSLSGPDPRCISGRPLAWRRRCPAHEAELAAGARSVAAIRAVAGAARRAGTERRDATRAGAREQQPRGGAEIEVETAVTALPRRRRCVADPSPEGIQHPSTHLVAT